ncbi:GNAT family N-acetyltransferase [Candidatus Woesearchaeota archaeon]|nr:GNAT family N-acetyltransferase [Candidatus Woesearchaeota archaeon]
MTEAKLDVIPVSEVDHIERFLNSCRNKDINCHPDYMGLFQKYLGAEAIYFFYSEGTKYILVPYFKRPIHSAENADTGFSDLISPWYFGGPIHNLKEDDSDFFDQFKKEFSKYCEKNNIVAEFQRLNPLFENHKVYQKDAGLSCDRPIVYVDLRKDIEVLRQEYTRHTRKNINKAGRAGLRVYHSEKESEIRQFIKLYSESMNRKKAGKFHHFNETFFEGLFQLFKNEIKLFYVEYEGKVISSSIALGKYGILYDYLRGTDPEYSILRPNDLLLDEIITWAKSNGHTYFVIGGGNSSSITDGLFRFKKSFSATTANFYIYKKIHNMQKYEEFCRNSGKTDLQYEQASFFPEYREGKS